MTYKTFFIKTVMAVGITIAATSCEGFLDITPDGQVKRDEMLEIGRASCRERV